VKKAWVDTSSPVRLIRGIAELDGPVASPVATLLGHQSEIFASSLDRKNYSVLLSGPMSASAEVDRLAGDMAKSIRIAHPVSYGYSEGEHHETIAYNLGRLTARVVIYGAALLAAIAGYRSFKRRGSRRTPPDR
jgi:hypothetical protein